MTVAFSCKSSIAIGFPTAARGPDGALPLRRLADAVHLDLAIGGAPDPGTGSKVPATSSTTEPEPVSTVGLGANPDYHTTTVRYGIPEPGRVRVEDSVDHAVGYSCTAKLGDYIKKGEEIGVIYCRKKTQGEAVSEKLRNAYKITREIPRTTKLIRATV